MANKTDRFEIIYKDGNQIMDSGMRQILLDKTTGVNYLCWKVGFGSTITPLLDSDGNVVITGKKI